MAISIHAPSAQGRTALLLIFSHVCSCCQPLLGNRAFRREIYTLLLWCRSTPSRIHWSWATKAETTFCFCASAAVHWVYFLHVLSVFHRLPNVTLLHPSEDFSVTSIVNVIPIRLLHNLAIKGFGAYHNDFLIVMMTSIDLNHVKHVWCYNPLKILDLFLFFEILTPSNIFSMPYPDLLYIKYQIIKKKKNTLRTSCKGSTHLEISPYEDSSLSHTCFSTSSLLSTCESTWRHPWHHRLQEDWGPLPQNTFSWTNLRYCSSLCPCEWASRGVGPANATGGAPLSPWGALTAATRLTALACQRGLVCEWQLTSHMEGLCGCSNV